MMSANHVRETRIAPRNDRCGRQFARVWLHEWHAEDTQACDAGKKRSTWKEAVRCCIRPLLNQSNLVASLVRRCPANKHHLRENLCVHLVLVRRVVLREPAEPRAVGRACVCADEPPQVCEEVPQVRHLWHVHVNSCSYQLNWLNNTASACGADWAGATCTRRRRSGRWSRSSCARISASTACSCCVSSRWTPASCSRTTCCGCSGTRTARAPICPPTTRPKQAASRATRRAISRRTAATASSRTSLDAARAKASNRSEPAHSTHWGPHWAQCLVTTEQSSSPGHSGPSTPLPYTHLRHTILLALHKRSTLSGLPNHCCSFFQFHARSCEEGDLS